MLRSSLTDWWRSWVPTAEVPKQGVLAGATVVLLPGWATDWLIFGDLCAGAHRVHPEGLLLPEYDAELAQVARQSPANSLLVVGWSLGAFCGVNLARAHPGRVKHLLLIGIRQRYPAARIASVRKMLLEDRRSCLRRFYRQCFLPDQRSDFRRFRQELMDRYITSWEARKLLRGLDYLERQRLSPAMLPACPTTIVHGEKDSVAPIREARQLAEGARHAQLRVIPDAGHAALMTDEFNSLLQQCLIPS